MKTRRISTDALKAIAAVTMVIDHIPYIFPNLPYYAFPWVIFHIIGRVAALVFFYMLAQGYKRTRNPNRYTARLLIFALISWLPYIQLIEGYVSWENIMGLNTLFTMLAGLLLLRAINEIKSFPLKLLGIAGAMLVGLFSDYGFEGMGFILLFYYTMDDKSRMVKAYLAAQLILQNSIFFKRFHGTDFGAIATWFSQPQFVWFAVFSFGYIIPAVLLHLHEDKPVPVGKAPPARRHPRFTKWFYYVFYPFQFIALIAVRWLLFGKL
ncbi:MAG: conjugal transfer protein TraX [Oscillospiraceae bacterium]|jgi:hypothetical protein|nr:conjugal transfer protein TraX [Oscillospiraceae bacterium]